MRGAFLFYDQVFLRGFCIKYVAIFERTFDSDLTTMTNKSKLDILGMLNEIL